MSDTAIPEGFRAGFVALVGRPNVGKSTLVNTLLGEKVSITSPKAQTTRTRIHGILNRPDSQLIFVDTPGLTRPETALRRAMRQVTGDAAAEADLQLVVVECRSATAELSEMDRDVLDIARTGHGPIVLAINKIDTMPRKDMMLPWIALYGQSPGIKAVVPISARTGDGLDVLLRELIALVPESPPLFPRDLHTDQAERFLCGELVREQLLKMLREEVPHSAAVIIEDFEDERREENGKTAGLVRIHGRIVIERESQKGIVVGKGGSMIKAVSEASRHEIEALVGCKVFLRLTVHVEAGWTDDERAMARLGLDPRGGAR
jgi:GTPase